MVRGRAGALILAMTLIWAGCAGDGSQGSASGATATAPVTAATTPPPSSTTTVAQAATTTTSSAAIGSSSTGGDDSRAAGSGVAHDLLMVSLEQLIEAENAMHAFEADWDAGMTYSETFQGWREVQAIVDGAFAGFEWPADASTAQLEAGQVYIEAVLSAQNEWQNVTDFIVTYITNYTPEALITRAYQDAEDHLDEAAAALEVIGDLGTS